MPDEFDWIIEYETLPPDDSLPTELPPPSGPRRRRIPRWLWPLGGLLIVVLAILIYLWTLGGEADPLPDPDPPSARLEAAVQLEISALLSGDKELFNQMQDRLSHRSNYQPSPDAWFGSQLAGWIDLIETRLLDEDSGIAEVELTWAQTPYRLSWFYRLVDDRWVHTDWQRFDAGEYESLRSSHLEILYHPIHQSQALALQSELDDFIYSFCALLDCPDEPWVISLRFDDYTAQYFASEDDSHGWHLQVEITTPTVTSEREENVLAYAIPSPLRIRWPSDGSPEPLVLSSLSRHVAHDLYTESRQEGLSPENRIALNLSAAWLAHHLTRSQALPTTLWLEEAVSADGLLAGVKYIRTLAASVHPQAALTAAFSPETVAAINTMPDHFGWLSLVLNPTNYTHPQPYPATAGLPLWDLPLAELFDWLADPWEAAGEFYSATAPRVVEVTYRDGWVIAKARPDTGWQPTYFFSRDDPFWTLGEPDESAFGPRRTIEKPLFSVTYWNWDEPNISRIVEILEITHQSLFSNLALSATNPISYLVTPYLAGSRSLTLPAGDMIQITSPDAGASTSSSEELSYEGGLVLTVMYEILKNHLVSIKPESQLLASAFFLWQYEQLAQQIGFSPYLGLPDLDEWQHPDGASEDSWRPLKELWLDWDPSNLTEPDIAQLYSYSRMVIRFIIEDYGTGKIPQMLTALNTANSMADWVQTVTEKPLDEFESEWRGWAVEN